MSAELYPSDLFRLRRDIRNYSHAPHDVTRQAECIGVRTMLKGIPQGQAFNSAKAFLWDYANKGYHGGSAA